MAMTDVGAFFWVVGHAEDGAPRVKLIVENIEDGPGGYPVTSGLRVDQEEFSLVPVEIPLWTAAARERRFGEKDPATPLPAMTAGEVFAAGYARGRPDGDRTAAALHGVRRIGSSPLEGGAAAVAFTRYPAGKIGYLTGRDDLFMDALQERSKLEKDEALVIACLPDGPDGRIHAFLAGHTGAYLFSHALHCSNDCREAGMDIPETPGVYVLRDGSPWSDNGNPGNDFEYDCGIDGRLAPATADDIVSFGQTDMSLAEKLRDEMDFEIPEGMGATEFLAMLPAPAPAPAAG